ncbi:GntR family transcriptional regulator [Streptomyces sp. NPDC052015]|uniref:GntR family transcriptional regulator n=1 Tax=Streptomyces sp. NPDC052015 TaxID=3154755 RepID=UPI0034350788
MTVPNDHITTPPDRPGETALYRFYDNSDRLLYVGITDCPRTRWADHRRYAAATWWPLATRVTVDWFGAREEAAALELQVIRTSAPLYNSGGAPSPHRERVPGERLCPRVNMERFREATGGGFQVPGRPWRNMDVAVAETIAEDIESGRLLAGAPMPSATELVNRFGVSVNTARRAVRQLVAAGEIEPRGSGSGTRYFVTMKRTDLADKQQGDEPVIEGQMGSQPLNGNDARAILGIVWKWIADANDGLGVDVGDLQHELEQAGYGPLPEAQGD